MLIQKLNNRGITHYVVPVITVLLIAIVGTYTQVASHADSETVSLASKTAQLPDLADDITEEDTPLIEKSIEQQQNQLPEDLRPKSGQAEPTVAEKGDARKTSLVIMRSQKVALDYWHDVQPDRKLCSQSNRGTDVRILYGNMGGHVLGETYLHGQPHGNKPGCTIWVNEVLKGRMYAKYADNLCETIVHEYGHLYGLRHSKNPDYIMYKKVTGDKLKRCNHV
jgi:hypothetical protein